MNYSPLIERLMQHYTSGPFAEEARRAKDEFSELAGAFDEASSDFDMKMSLFTDWYLFTRPSVRSGQPFVEGANEDPAFLVAEGERPLFHNLRNSRLSLFEFLKLKGDDVFIRDLFTAFKYVIRQSRVTIGFNRDEYFQARLIPFESGFVFSEAFCFHPASVSRFIAKHIKVINRMPDVDQASAREDFLRRLFRMRYKVDQYRHLDVHDIYSDQPKLRI
jgi:hypothetical protein